MTDLLESLLESRKRLLIARKERVEHYQFENRSRFKREVVSLDLDIAKIDFAIRLERRKHDGMDTASKESILLTSV